MPGNVHIYICIYVKNIYIYICLKLNIWPPELHKFPVFLLEKGRKLSKKVVKSK